MKTIDGLTKRQIKAERKALIAKQLETPKGTPQWYSEHDLMMARRYHHDAMYELDLVLDGDTPRRHRAMYLGWYCRDKIRYRKQLESIKRTRLAAVRHHDYPLWCNIGGDVPFSKGGV